MIMKCSRCGSRLETHKSESEDFVLWCDQCMTKNKHKAIKKVKPKKHSEEYSNAREEN